MFFKNLTKKLFGFCVLGFVTGVFVCIIMPPIVIAVIEAVLLALLCISLYCSR